MAERNEDQWTDSDRAMGDADKGNTDTSAIRAEIAETRERMSDTLDEIGSRLNPHVVKEQVTQRVKEGIREATIGRVEDMARNAVDKVNETRYTLTDTVRDNPIPAALVAIGLGWMMINSRSTASRSRYWDERSTMDRQSPSYGLGGYDSMRTGSMGVGAEGYEEGKLDQARERVADVADAARERVHDLTDTAKERANELAYRARDAADTVRTRAQELAHNAADTTRRTAVRVEDMYQENPLALGAVTLAIGVAAGFAVPRTDREVQFFGDAREQVVDRVREVADETKEKVQHVASRVVDEAKTAARDEGLTGA
jgi:ElaB/YqjD/DUF883 family membrane-anchored ribosome-binding protein